MKTKAVATYLLSACLVLAVYSGCHRHDPRENSNPHPQGAVKQPQAAPAATPPPADAKTGTDSTGRPSDASGGTTGADKKGTTKDAPKGN